ncbi:hypothetical protein ABMC89_18840 [Sulfitobacter sp. HNIBRBA3233]|uniref:T4SS efffector SepA family protein n=1 Tax=Sulfitobacter marinivivus TaxID=3158558 RepID=UPI0032DEEA5C
MMPVIRLNDATFVDLKSISTWIGAKTPSETIVRLVQEKMEALDLERDIDPDLVQQKGSGAHMAFDNAPGLSFTKVLSAKVDGNSLQKPNWAGILLAAIGALTNKGISGQNLIKELQVPAKSAVYEEDGYRYHAELGISVQGQSAQDAWREVSRIANKHLIPVEVTFQWRENEKAQHPGRTGQLCAGN